MCWVLLGVNAQNTHPWEQYLNQVMAAEDVESDTWQQTYDLLCDLEQHPMDINTASREQLEMLPFLSSQHIEALMDYQDHYGPMKSKAELLMITALGPSVRRLLDYFVYVGDEKPKRYLHHELVATAKLPLSGGHWSRYQLQYGDRLKAGLVGDQDADEPFFKGINKGGYDFYSPYLQINRWGRLETLVIGCYRVSMGMGLVMNNCFSQGKIAMLQNLGRSTNILRAHSSRTESCLQGIGATVNMGRGLHATAFVSYAPMDGTLNGNGSVRTILTSGYHRTETEQAKKHNLHALKAGGALHYQAHGWRLGLNGLYVHLDRQLRPNTKQLHNLYKPQGCDFVNVGADYGYTGHRWALNGETATDGNGHLATINTVSVAMDNGLTLMALQRFYSYQYTSLDAQSYSDGGYVQNESGIYVGATWQPSPKWQLMAYTDYAYFPWFRYGEQQASWSMDHLLQCIHTSDKWKLSARYRLKIRQQEHRARLSAEYDAKMGFSFRTQFDGNYLATSVPEYGGMLSEHVAYSYKWLRLNAGAGYYHTDSYQSRLYLYEDGPLYSYSMQQFYGEGIRYWLMLRVNVFTNLMLAAKMGVSNDFDRQAETDMNVQVRWKI